MEDSNAAAAPLASTQAAAAICSRNTTRQPSRQKPRVQLMRAHAAPPFPGLFANAPLTTARGMRLGDPELRQQATKDFVGIEVRLRQLAGGSSMTGVVRRNGMRPDACLLERAEGDQA